MAPPPVASLDVRDTPAADSYPAPRHPAGLASLARRIWGVPLRFHAALLLAILAGLAAWIGPGYSFSNDEGASVLQAQAIAQGHWVIPAPIPRLDAGGRYYPIELSAGGPKGYAPLGKHLFYGVLLALVYRIGGLVGMVGLSLLGTVAAALLAAALSRELAPGFERLTLWFTALATPLLFDGFLIVGQTVAAALTTGAALLVLRYLTRGDWRLLPAAAACCVPACLLRTEAEIWCAALASAAVLVALALPRFRPGGGGDSPAASFPTHRGFAAAGTLGAAAVFGRLADQLLTRHALGAVSSFTSTPAQGQSVLDQAHGGFVSLLQAGSDPWSTGGALIVVALGLVALVARLFKRGRTSTAGIVVVAGVVLVLWLFRAWSYPADAIPGLAVAAPVLWLGVWLSDRTRLRNPAGWICLLAPALFFLGVLATEYANGGGLQWGGRFYAISLPVVVPVAVLNLAREGRRLAPAARHAVTGVALTLTVVLAASGLWTLRSGHEVGRQSQAELTAVARQAPAGDGGAPILVTTSAVWPRYEWQVYPHVRWQLATLGSLRTWSTDLAGLGVDRFVLVSANPLFEVAVMSPLYHAGPATPLVGGFVAIEFTRTTPAASRS